MSAPAGTIKCEDCGLDQSSENSTCTACGSALSVATDSVDQAGEDVFTSPVPVDEDMLVAQASVPNLAALFQQGKKSGLIKPVQDYGQSV